MFPKYIKILSDRMPNCKDNSGYYLHKETTIGVAEYGQLFSKENLVYLTKLFFHNLLKVLITNKGGYAEVTEVEYKFVYNPLKDKFSSNKGWLPLTVDNLDSLTFDVGDFYDRQDDADAKEIASRLDELRKVAEEIARQEKENKAEIKAELKAKRDAKAKAKLEKEEG